MIVKVEVLVKHRWRKFTNDVSDAVVQLKCHGTVDAVNNDRMYCLETMKIDITTQWVQRKVRFFEQLRDNRNGLLHHIVSHDVWKPQRKSFRT